MRQKKRQRRIKNRFRVVFMLFGLILLFSISFMITNTVVNKNRLFVAATPTSKEQVLRGEIENTKKYNDVTQVVKEKEEARTAREVVEKQRLENKEKEEKEKQRIEEEQATQKTTATTTQRDKSKDPIMHETNKIAYLTFDDGPTPRITSEILDILKKEDVKATFFVVGRMAEQNPTLLKREKQEGHVIGNHTFSHNYTYLYQNTGNFLQDLKKGESVIESAVGEYNKTLIRFPGGSFNRGVFQKSVQASGYHYVDWNCLNGDAEAPYRSKEQLIARFKETMGGQNHLTILMHDAPGKETTVQALPFIIQHLKSNGYIFETLK